MNEDLGRYLVKIVDGPTEVLIAEFEINQTYYDDLRDGNEDKQVEAITDLADGYIRKHKIKAGRDWFAYIHDPHHKTYLAEWLDDFIKLNITHALIHPSDYVRRRAKQLCP